MCCKRCTWPGQGSFSLLKCRLKPSPQHIRDVVSVLDIKSSTSPPLKMDLGAHPSGEQCAAPKNQIITTLVTHLLLSWTCIDMASLLLGSSRRSVILHVHAVSPAVVPGTCGTENPGRCHLLALQNSYLNFKEFENITHNSK